MIKHRFLDEIGMLSCPQELEPGVQLSVAHGVAYLKGHVSSYERKKALGSMVDAFPSVERVVNLLRVMPGGLRADDTIQKEVMEALSAVSRSDRGEVSVRVANGVVEMEGSVPDLSARIAVEAVAWSVWGIQHVRNRLEIRPEPKSDVPGTVGEL